MSLVSLLEAGRSDFLEATSITENIRPLSGWSVLECIEHVVTVEQRHLEWIASAEEITPRRDSEKERRLFSIMRSRLTRLETPQRLLPRGRFTTVEAAVAAFQVVRTQSVATARECGAAIYALGVTHPYFGILNGAEVMQLVDGHARRHAEQIREIVERAA